MLLEVLTYPHPFLKQKSQPVERVTAETRALITNMFETMYHENGVGLAAPQVGVGQRILVLDVGKLENETTKPDPIAIINPVIKTTEGSITWDEGCLSLPELIVPVERHGNIIVEGLDKDGQPLKILGEQLLSVALQHEMDHLEGVLLVDRLSRMKRNIYAKKREKEKVLQPVQTMPIGGKPYL